jgi:transcriptional regulator with XRE-family HTH domain
MLINTKLGNLIGEELKKQGKSYEDISKVTGISKTYLTDIIVKGKIPSLEIVEKICDALGIDPKQLREYRVLLIQDKLSKNYLFLKEEQLNDIEKLLGVESEQDTGADFSKRTYRLEEGNRWLDLEKLNGKQREYINKMIEELKKMSR